MFMFKIRFASSLIICVCEFLCVRVFLRTYTLPLIDTGFRSFLFVCLFVCCLFREAASSNCASVTDLLWPFFCFWHKTIRMIFTDRISIWAILLSTAIMLTIMQGPTGAAAETTSSNSSILAAAGTEAKSCSRNYDLDHLVFSLQWPSSFCLEKLECNLQIARNKKWLIHGLWPNRAWKSGGGGGGGGGGGRKPNRKRRQSNQTQGSPAQPANFKRHPNSQIEFCCGPTYNQTFDSRLYRELLTVWPTLHPNGKNHGFWRHEWRKHGTCARQVPQLKNQTAYFETVLALYKRFDLNRVPLSGNQTYQLEQLHRAIEPAVGGKRVRLECSLVNRNNTGSANSSSIGARNTATNNTVNSTNFGNHNNNNSKMSILYEVRICLSKALQPIDCVGNDDYQCKRRVLFP